MERPLTAGEIALARTMFGDAIDYGAARIANRKWAFFQPRNVAMAPRGCIHFNPRGTAYSPDFASEPLAVQAFFLHELTHVWQHQQGVNLLVRRHPFCRYSYAIYPGRPFHRYGIEQQAEIVRHAFLVRHGAGVPGAPPLATYESILPFTADHKRW